MAGYKSLEKRRRKLVLAAVVGVSVLTIFLAVTLLQRTPPRRIVLATGQSGGVFDTFGGEYQKRLGHLGLQVEIVQTNGSVDNLHRLLQQKVDLAFVQGGTYPLVDDEEQNLRGLAAVYYEPLWIFYRSEKPLAHLGDFKGKIISVGPKHSGTEALALAMLKVHGVNEDNGHFLNKHLVEAHKALQEGTIDVLLAVSSYKDKTIQEMLRAKDLHMWNFRREAAYCRTFPYLTPVKLSEGILDLGLNIPSEDRTLLAPSALLISRADLDPKVVEQILKVAQAIHSPGSLIDPPLKFPSLDSLDVPVHEAAETYLKSGESLLSRLLPYWGVRLLYQARVLLLPVLLLWLPFLKVLPMIYNYRVTNLLKKHYVALREVEDALALANDPERLRSHLKTLENLVYDMESLSRKIPGHLQRDVYHWRLHVAMVKNEALDRLKRLEAKLEMLGSPSFMENLSVVKP
jgi:TRAP transporter TAXI family solute receptor